VELDDAKLREAIRKQEELDAAELDGDERKRKFNSLRANEGEVCCPLERWMTLALRAGHSVADVPRLRSACRPLLKRWRPGA